MGCGQTIAFVRCPRRPTDPYSSIMDGVILELELHSLSRQGHGEDDGRGARRADLDPDVGERSITESAVEIARRFAGIADRELACRPDDDALALLEAIRGDI